MRRPGLIRLGLLAVATLWACWWGSLAIMNLWQALGS